MLFLLTLKPLLGLVPNPIIESLKFQIFLSKTQNLDTSQNNKNSFLDIYLSPIPNSLFVL